MSCNFQRKLDPCTYFPPYTFPKFHANITAITIPPTPNAATPATSRIKKSPTRNTNKYPTTKLNAPHNTFIIGEDSPFPGGEANGDGNLLPITPLTKCGTAFTRKNPPKK